jgi:hypothetical protein
LNSLSSLDGYKNAIKIAREDEFYPDERSELLRKLERGTVFYLSGNYYQALQNFAEARRKSDELFTKSLGGKLKSLGSENLDKYYGERYERSLIRFYESLVNYKLYRTGFYEAHTLMEGGKNLGIPKKELTDTEKRRHLMNARSVLVEWDSLMNSYKAELAGKSTYKVDLLAKLWAGFIHEQFDTAEDRQIALQLYRDAKGVLLKYYNVYPPFNRKYKSFDDNFSKLAIMPLAEVRSKFIDSTSVAKDVEIFIDSKIEKLSENRKDNLFILLSDSFVSPKTAKKFKIGVSIDILMHVGNNDQEFVAFVRNELSETNKKDTMPLVEFEIPQIEPSKKEWVPYWVSISEADSKKEIAKFRLILVEPVTDIAVKSLNDRMALVYLQTCATVATKYATAMYAAYKIYKGNRSTLGAMLATASYLTAARALAETTMADLRYWSSLADRIYIGSTRLKPGKYNLTILPEKYIAGSKFVGYTQVINIGHSGSEFIDLSI